MLEADEVVVFLDACTLVPSSLRDVLLRCSAEGLFRIHWSQDVLDEVQRTLVHDLGVDEGRVRHLVETMNRAFPDAQVDGYRSLLPRLDVDSGDRHVLAAAIVANVDFILTRNVRHFPEDTVSPFGVTVLPPDDFLVSLAELHSDVMLSVVRERATDLGDSLEEAFGFLHEHVPGLVEVLRRVSAD